MPNQVNHPLRLFARHPGKVIEEGLQRIARVQVLEEAPDRHASAPEHRHAAEPCRVALDEARQQAGRINIQIQSQWHMLLPLNLPCASALAQLEVQPGDVDQIKRREVDRTAKVTFGNRLQVHAHAGSFRLDIGAGFDLSVLE